MKRNGSNQINIWQEDKTVGSQITIINREQAFVKNVIH